jgi:hypothetical protein
VDRDPDTEQLLREIARWTREAALPAARERVRRLLDSDPKKRVYEALAEGTSSVSAVEKATGANHNDINAWLRTWEHEGIVQRGGSRRKAVFTLSELGIEPAPPRTARRRRTTT